MGKGVRCTHRGTCRPKISQLLLPSAPVSAHTDRSTSLAVNKVRGKERWLAVVDGVGELCVASLHTTVPNKSFLFDRLCVSRYAVKK